MAARQQYIVAAGRGEPPIDFDRVLSGLEEVAPQDAGAVGQRRRVQIIATEDGVARLRSRLPSSARIEPVTEFKHG